MWQDQDEPLGFPLAVAIMVSLYLVVKLFS